MANLLVHYAVGHAAGKALKSPQDRLALVVGNVLPDLAFKGMFFLGGASSPFAEPSHAPLMLPFFAALAALAFAPRLRMRMFAWLLVGAAMHVLLDAGKDYAGAGVIYWAFPLSFDRWQWGLYDAIPWWATYPIAIAIIVIAEALTTVRRSALPAPSTPK